MLALDRFYRLSVLAALVLAPSLASAGVPSASVIVGPPSATAAAAAAAVVAVPTLTDSLLVVLGLLLIVVAVRTLQSQRGAHKLLSVLVLGGGLVVGGVGVERAVASITVTASGDVCTADGSIPYDPGVYSSLGNGCPNIIEIKEFMEPEETSCVLDYDSAGCAVGDQLAAKDGETIDFCGPLPQVICDT